jgi:hypothetical protein
VSKKKQDKALDNIEKGIVTLKGIGEAMGEELRHQNILADEIESKVGPPCVLTEIPTSFVIIPMSFVMLPKSFSPNQRAIPLFVKAELAKP